MSAFLLAGCQSTAPQLQPIDPTDTLYEGQATFLTGGCSSSRAQKSYPMIMLTQGMPEQRFFGELRGRDAPFQISGSVAEDRTLEGRGTRSGAGRLTVAGRIATDRIDGHFEYRAFRYVCGGDFTVTRVSQTTG